MANTRRSTKRKTKTAQQWAWEFLRRNPVYRDAFQKLAELSPEQLAHIEMHRIADEDQQIDEEIVRTLDIQFFDTSQMSGFKEDQKTVGEYITQSQEYRDLVQESGIHLTVSKKFILETYSLVKWYDPNIELTATEVAAMWHHELPLEFGLIRAANGDGLKTDEEFIAENKSSEWPWPPRPADITPKKGVDMRRRKSPVHTLLGLVAVSRGADQRTFVRSDGRIRGLRPLQACAIFDLSLPIEFQLNRARASLEQHQKDLAQSGFVQSLPKQADRFGTFTKYLEILDLLNDGLTHLAIAEKLDGLTTDFNWKHDPKANKPRKVTRVVDKSKPGASINQLTQSVRKKIERAIHLRDHGYRALAFSA